MGEFEIIKILLDLGLTAVFAWLFMGEKKERQAMQEKIYQQLQIQATIEKEWLVALGKLTEVLGKIQETSNGLLGKVDGQNEVLHEIVAGVEMVQANVQSKELVATIIEAYIAERRGPPPKERHPATPRTPG